MAVITAPSSFRSNTPHQDYIAFGHVNNAVELVPARAGHMVILHGILVAPVGTVDGDYTVRSGTTDAASNIRLLGKVKGTSQADSFNAFALPDPSGVAFSVVGEGLWGHFDGTETMRTTLSFSYVKADDE